MIHRSLTRERYLIVSKVAIEDNRLSWKARGILIFLLSKPDDWNVIVAYLINQSPDGRSAVMAALKELEDCGYMARNHRPKVAGRYDGIDCEVFEEPRKKPDATVSDIQHPHRVRFSATDNQPLLSNEVLNTELLKKEAEIVQIADHRKHIARIKRTLRAPQKQEGEQ